MPQDSEKPEKTCNNFEPVWDAGFYSFISGIPFVREQIELYAGSVKGYAARMGSDARLNTRLLCGGCGIGASLKELASISPLKLVGLDHDSNILEAAKNNLKNVSNVYLCRGDVLDLPFMSNSFDVYGLINVVHFIQETDKLFSEMIRVLKPGGLFVITGAVPEYKSEPFIQAGMDYLEEIGADERLRQQVSEYVKQQKQRESMIKREGLFSLESICALLEAAYGCTIKDSKPSYLKQGYFVVASR